MQSPDQLLCGVFAVNSAGVVDVLRRQAAELASPPLTFAQLLGRLERVVPDLVSRVRAYEPHPSPAPLRLVRGRPQATRKC